MSKNLDFRYIPPEEKQVQLFMGMPVPEKAAGLWYAGQIERYAVRTDWKDLIATIPDEHRERAASYLRDRWRIINHREKLAIMGKQCQAGDEALSALEKIFHERERT